MTEGDRPLLAVLDYEIGNLRSAQKALARVGADARLTADPKLVESADGVVLPGVGAFGRCMDALDRTKLSTVARDAVARNQPFLGICIGMQLLYDESEENPDRPGLGILPGVVRKLPTGVKHPQMQWNTIDVKRPSSLLDGVAEPRWFYFVHSYAPDDTSHAVATCDYGGPVVVMVERNNVAATQFHPEKSGANGLALLRAFVERCRR